MSATHATDPRDCLTRAEACLTQQGSALQRSQAAALLSHHPLTAEQGAELLADQLPDGGWPAFWSSNRCSVDATSYRITQALAAGLSLASTAALARGADWLAKRQQADGIWQEDAALAHDAPPWARPADLAATLYLTANAGWVMARCSYAPNAALAARALTVRLEADGSLPSFPQTQWLAAGLWLLQGDEEIATRALHTIQARTAEYSAGQCIWLLNCLLDSGLARSHPVIRDADARVRALQQADGSWLSDDGPMFTPQTTLEAMRAITLQRA